jgi:hypothetical protein
MNTQAISTTVPTVAAVELIGRAENNRQPTYAGRERNNQKGFKNRRRFIGIRYLRMLVALE